MRGVVVRVNIYVTILTLQETPAAVVQKIIQDNSIAATPTISVQNVSYGGHIGPVLE